MYKLEAEKMELLLTYNDFYGNDKIKPNLKEEVKNLNMNKAISIISELIAIRNKDLELDFKLTKINFPFETILKYNLLHLNPYDLVTNPLINKNKHIISLQMLLNLLKYIIAYGNYDTINDKKYSLTFEDYKKIIDLQMLIAESFDVQLQEFDANKQAHFIYSNYHINENKDTANAAIRTYYMLPVILNHPELLDEDVQTEYVDYGTNFKIKYGYTILDYICFIFCELGTYFHEANLTYNSTWKDINTMYKCNNLSSESKKILDDLSVTPLDLQEWSLTTISNMWNFGKFYMKPFLRLSNYYISISDLTLDNALFENLFWMIRNCYPSSNSTCMAFYGRLFEKYAQTVIKSASKQSENYRYIPEFKCKSGNKSSDAYLQYKDDLIIIECKGFSILINTLINGEDIEKNNDKLFIKPILQADNRFNEIVTIDKKFTDIKQTFIISVTMNNINAVPQYYDEIYKEVESKRKSQMTKYIYNFNIEEYETLMYLVENNYDVIKLLENYYNRQVIEPFKSYVLEKFPDKNMRPECLNKIYKDLSSELVSRLFTDI